MTEHDEVIEETGEKQASPADRIRKWRFPKGVSGNPNGRPISPTRRIKQIFRENPEEFDAWIVDYMEDKQNRKHVVEMIDGKPKQKTDVTTDGKPITEPSALKVVATKVTDILKS